jgi:ABC-type uncharacterized transport system involved in gliding motility auxiliary subunit
MLSVETLKNLEVGKTQKSEALGYAYQGPVKSAFASPSPISDPNAPPGESKKPARVVVIGDSDFANDEHNQLARVFPIYTAGPQLLYNAIGWILEDEALTPLRTKTLSPRPIQVASESTATLIQWGNVLGLPVAFCLFGLVRWRVRRATRSGLKL